jgi:hypothetical protein
VPDRWPAQIGDACHAVVPVAGGKAQLQAGAVTHQAPLPDPDGVGGADAGQRAPAPARRAPPWPPWPYSSATRYASDKKGKCSTLSFRQAAAASGRSAPQHRGAGRARAAPPRVRAARERCARAPRTASPPARVCRSLARERHLPAAARPPPAVADAWPRPRAGCAVERQAGRGQPYGFHCRPRRLDSAAGHIECGSPPPWREELASLHRQDPLSPRSRPTTTWASRIPAGPRYREARAHREKALPSSSGNSVTAIDPGACRPGSQPPRWAVRFTNPSKVRHGLRPALCGQ